MERGIETVRKVLKKLMPYSMHDIKSTYSQIADVLNASLSASIGKNILTRRNLLKKIRLQNYSDNEIYVLREYYNRINAILIYEDHEFIINEMTPDSKGNPQKYIWLVISLIVRNIRLRNRITIDQLLE
jgi:hypothetical protein